VAVDAIVAVAIVAVAMAAETVTKVRAESATACRREVPTESRGRLVVKGSNGVVISICSVSSLSLPQDAICSARTEGLRQDDAAVVNHDTC
jgi:hypothetical protein